MTLRRLKWLTVVGPVLFYLAIEGLQHWVAPRFFTSWPGALLVGVTVLLAALFFAEMVFAEIEGFQEHLAQHNSELVALQQAGLDISSHLELSSVLQDIVNHARRLAAARYAIVSVSATPGEPAMRCTSRTSPQEWKSIQRLLSTGGADDSDAYLDPDAAHEGPEDSPGLHVPIMSGEGVLGEL